MRNLFKKEPVIRIVAACGGYIAQYKKRGIAKDLYLWLQPEHQRTYCVCKTREEAQARAYSYWTIIS